MAKSFQFAQYQTGGTLLDTGQYHQAIEHLEAADAAHDLAIYKQIKHQKRETGNPQPKQ